MWGYDYARAVDLDKDKSYVKTKIGVPDRKRQLSQELPVYDIKPLLDATQELFGTVDN